MNEIVFHRKEWPQTNGLRSESELRHRCKLRQYQKSLNMKI